MEGSQTILHYWFEELWNKGREEVIDELFPDGLAHGIGDTALRGADDYKVFFRTFRSALPDIQVSIEDWVSNGDKLAVRCLARATHTGEGLGFAPTNKPVECSFIAFVRIEDNKIAEAWNVVDFLQLYKQLDAVTFK